MSEMGSCDHPPVDDNTRNVLVTAIQVGGGLVVGLAVAAIGFWSSRKLERERWARDDRLREREAAADRDRRWLDRRREMYAMLIATSVEAWARRPEAPPELALRGYAVAAEIGLIRPDLHLPALFLIQRAGKEAASDDEAANAEFQQVLDAFEAAAVADLAS